MRFPIVYLHIPKTAGTSFRVSAEKYFGKKNILLDYGVASKSTSDEILSTYYRGEDIDALRAQGANKKFLGGHFSLPRYREIFPDSPVVTFFREPVSRVVSEYVHFSNHHGYTGTLEDFYRTAEFQNRQHHTLGGLKPSALDFFGLTEQYEKSLSMFNQLFSTDLQLSVLNKGSYDRGLAVKPTPEQVEEMRHLNQADIAAYASALETFENQTRDIKDTHSVVGRYDGRLGGIKDEHLFGWVIDKESEKPATLRVVVNGAQLMTVTADKARPDLVVKGLHADGKCGFEIPLKDLGNIKNHDSISVMSEDGTFELLNSPLILAA